MTDQQAFEMGLRWLDAGFKTSRQTKWLSHDAATQGDAPDPRDPGNKGHAIAQLRERTGDPYICTQAYRDVLPDDTERTLWAVWSDKISLTNHEGADSITEEEAITAALEAAKP